MGSADEGDPSRSRRNGKLRIPLPFEDALRAATNVPADKLARPNRKSPKAPRRKPAKG